MNYLNSTRKVALGLLRTTKSSWKVIKSTKNFFQSRYSRWLSIFVHVVKNILAIRFRKSKRYLVLKWTLFTTYVMCIRCFVINWEVLSVTINSRRLLVTRITFVILEIRTLAAAVMSTGRRVEIRVYVSCHVSITFIIWHVRNVVL